MGSPEDEQGRYPDEGPQHEVIISYSFEMLTTEVSQSMWEEVMGSNPSTFIDPDHPVESVSWDDCQDFITQLNLLDNAPFALKHLSPVKVYLGSGRYAARAFLLDQASGQKLDPGRKALMQIILESPLTCCRGDRFLLRDDSETVTLGGGVVLDPLAPRSKTTLSSVPVGKLRLKLEGIATRFLASTA